MSALLCAGALGAIQTGRPGGDVSWASSYEAGIAQARQARKPVLLSFHTPGCGWCRKMDAETYTDTQVVNLAQKYVCIRVDSGGESAVVDKYQVTAYPQTLFLTSEGKEMARVPGYVPPDQFAALLEALAKKVAAR